MVHRSQESHIDEADVLNQFLKFIASMAVPPATVRIPSQRPLALSVACHVGRQRNDPRGCAQISWHLPYN